MISDTFFPSKLLIESNALFSDVEGVKRQFTFERFCPKASVVFKEFRMNHIAVRLIPLAIVDTTLFIDLSWFSEQSRCKYIRINEYVQRKICEIMLKFKFINPNIDKIKKYYFAYC
ncbi:MAG: hypothetical protein OHK0038_21010 [Flammeovirgaceae bacterium]